MNTPSTLSDLHAVNEALRSCLSLEDKPAWPAELKRLSMPDWDLFFSRASIHRLTPLIARRLANAGSPCPTTVLERCNDDYRASAAVAAQAWDELQHLALALAKVDVPVVVLKGAFLASHVFDEPALRPMADIDLLARTQDLARARAVLFELEYVSTEYASTEEEQANLTGEPHLPPFSKAGALKVDLHWTIESAWMTTRPTNRFAVNVERLWQHAEPLRRGPAGLLALSLDDLLFHLCLHVSLQHGFDVRLLNLYDIALLIQRCHVRLDWERLGETARAHGVERLIAALLLASLAMFNADCLVSVPLLLHEDDRAIPDAINRHILAAPERDSEEWHRTRNPLIRWLLHANGIHR